MPESRFPPHRTEREQDARVLQERELAVEPDAAPAQFLGRGPVRRRSAPARRDDERVREPQSVVDVRAGRLIRESRPMKGRVQEIAAPVAGEHPSGAVPAMGRRGEAHQHQSRPRISEPGNGPRPVRPVAKALHLLLATQLPPRDEARTGAALDHVALQVPEPAWTTLRSGNAQGSCSTQPQLPRVPPRPPPRWLPRGICWPGPRIPKPPFAPRSSCPPAPKALRNPVLPCWGPLSSASFTIRARPPKSFPFSCSMATFACSSVSRSTKAKPRGRPVSRSVTILIETTLRSSVSNTCRICFSVASYGRFPTYSLRVMTISWEASLRHSTARANGRGDLLTGNRAPLAALWHLPPVGKPGPSRRPPARRDKTLRHVHCPGRRLSRHPARGSIRPAWTKRRGEDHPHQPRRRHLKEDLGRRGGPGPRRGARLPGHPPRRRPRPAGDQLRSLLHRRGDASVPSRLLRDRARGRAAGRDPLRPRPPRQARFEHPRALGRDEAPPPHRQGAGPQAHRALSRRAYRGRRRGAAPRPVGVRPQARGGGDDHRPHHPLSGGGGRARRTDRRDQERPPPRGRGQVRAAVTLRPPDGAAAGPPAAGAEA